MVLCVRSTHFTLHPFGPVLKVAESFAPIERQRIEPEWRENPADRDEPHAPREQPDRAVLDVPRDDIVHDQHREDLYRL